MQIQSKIIDYSHAGLRMTGYLADGRSTAERTASVLLAHEAPGMSPLMRERADALAELGYVAFALDLHGAGFDAAEARQRHLELMDTPFLIRDRATAALDVLLDQPGVDPARVAAAGFCQGGITVMELARARAPIQCAVGVHPGFKRPRGTPEGPIDAHVLMITGNEDPMASADDRAAFADEMDAAGAPWEIHLFGGVQHAFTNVGVESLGVAGLHYDARATRRSWAMMLELFDETISEGITRQARRLLPSRAS